MIKRYVIYLMLSGFLFILIACGKGLPGVDSAPAPESATITITPSAVSITDGGSTTVTDTQYFHIVVTDTSKGIPLGNVEITISFSWAVPSPAGLVQLYHDGNPVNSPLTVDTDSYGSYDLRFDYQRGSLDYDGTLLVTSGSRSATATFAVASSSSSS